MESRDPGPTYEVPGPVPPRGPGSCVPGLGSHFSGMPKNCSSVYLDKIKQRPLVRRYEHLRKPIFTDKNFQYSKKSATSVWKFRIETVDKCCERIDAYISSTMIVKYYWKICETF